MPEQINLKKLSDFDNKSLLIVDDDNPFRDRLARAMEKKGFTVLQAESVQKGIQAVKSNKPGFAVVDLRLADGNGLEVVKEIQVSNPTSRIIMLTGYGNIPTAVAALKKGPLIIWQNLQMLMMLKKHYWQIHKRKLNHPKIRCQQIELSGNIFIEFLNYVTEMYQKLLEDLRCTEELYKEYYLKDLLDKFS